jgi:lipopolysaccharide transport system ATP-binding protein
MAEPIISVEGVGKVYRLQHQQGERYTALRDVIAHNVKSLFRGAAKPATAEEDFWALKDVSFDVPQGEVVGIIGRNGAGKSTLLKILSRITEPTTGRITLRGRVASLLEVGTGFHPELTGRENIFLNGAILGMSRAEISSKFDEIVAFAEVEKFLDTPVKRYSSGMYVRLAFAVAAHLEPEILVVDEVLAVGDAQFQKKCLGKISEVSNAEGRTVLLVSHNMAAVQTICQRVIRMDGGRLCGDGSPKDMVAAHLAGSTDTPSTRQWEAGHRPENDAIALYGVSVKAPEPETVITVDTGAVIQVDFENKKDRVCLDCNVYVVTDQGVMLFESFALLEPVGEARAGRYLMDATIPGHLLNAGRYSVHVTFGLNQSYVLLRQEDAVGFDVENTSTGRGSNMKVTQGVIRPLLQWRQQLVQGSTQLNAKLTS